MNRGALTGRRHERYTATGIWPALLTNAAKTVPSGLLFDGVDAAHHRQAQD